jgi:hypothetical protein
MIALDRDGIFKAIPQSWAIRKNDQTQSVGISIEFLITAQLEGSEWTPWAGYADHSVWGTFYVVKKDGTVNQSAVEQLAQSLGWNGDLRAITLGPPATEVQITVKEEIYDGKSRLKATWINPGDYSPQPSGASQEDMTKLQTRYGSLLRAAVAGATKNGPPLQAKKPTPPPPAEDSAEPGDDLPF